MIGRIKLLVLLCIFGTTLSLRIPFNKRQSACADISITTDATGGYTVLSDYGITIEDSEDIKIKLRIKASHDAEIVLMSTDSINDPLYKIILGGSDNTVSMIQDGQNGKIKALYNGPVLQNGFTKFMITLKNDKIKVKDGDKNKILKWKDNKNPLKVVNVGIATKDSESGVWLFPCNQEPNPSPSPATCTNGKLSCDDGEGCYPSEWKCDNIKDCDDNSDEEECEEPNSSPSPVTCTNGELSCDNGEGCYPSDWKCDNIKDCDDNSDEEECEDMSTPAPTSATGGCSEGYFKCDSTDECYDNSWKCDDITDCSDGSDEQNCGDDGDKSTPAPTSGPTSAPGTCSDGQFKCKTGNEGQCYVNSWKCDKIKDCDDGSDEENCDTAPVTEIPVTQGPVTQGPVTQRPVTQAPTGCTSEANKCNGYADCVDGSDEDSTMCSTFTCPSGSSKCSDGVTCISDSAKCDGYQDCPAGDDEANCAAATCSNNQFKCPNSFCLAKSGKCNGIPECPNGEDESGCSGCPKNTQKRCDDGSMCILKSEKCDGITDCSDKSDEANCPSRRTTLTRFQRLLDHLRSNNKRSPNHETMAQKAVRKMDQVKRNFNEATLRRVNSDEGVKRHQRAMKARHESLQRQLVERRRNLAMSSRHSKERRQYKG
ncbi:low-density lipoprotein receptor-related protein 1-like isoform X2 [Mytilus trossulus]|uniref:low-density lipoprotein receptor-related protein 1-like isoform X2 n=1 Tax=Mytilus trossulus TaxID=6551 RepID=UPI003006BD0D